MHPISVKRPRSSFPPLTTLQNCLLYITLYYISSSYTKIWNVTSWLKHMYAVLQTGKDQHIFTPRGRLTALKPDPAGRGTIARFILSQLDCWYMLQLKNKPNVKREKMSKNIYRRRRMSRVRIGGAESRRWVNKKARSLLTGTKILTRRWNRCTGPSDAT